MYLLSNWAKAKEGVAGCHDSYPNYRSAASPLAQQTNKQTMRVHDGRKFSPWNYVHYYISRQQRLRKLSTH